MASSCFLGIDFGTSGVRACVIAGNEEIETIERLDFGALQGFEMAAAWREGLFDVMTKVPLGLRRKLAAIAIDGTSGTVVPCDEALLPSYEPLLYNDSRARFEAEQIARAAGADHPAAVPTSGLAKILWLRHRLGTERNHLFLNQADWLNALLSDLPGVSDYHNALKMGFDVESRHWPEWVAYLVDIDTLPNPVVPGSPINTISRPRARDLGINPDCLVRTGTTDSIAAFLAAGASQPGEAVTSLGSTLVLKLLSTRKVESAADGIYSHWFGALWLAGGASNAGGKVLAEHFSTDELIELSRQIDPNQDSGLDYYPLSIPGERFPINDPNLPPRIAPRPLDRSHFLHGLLQGLARIEALGYRKLAEQGASPLREVISAGGGARNPTYTRLRERQLGVPVSAAREQEAAFGAARLALHGPRIFPEHDNA